MTDRIEQLERLTRLKASGSLTEAEFVEEKARLMNKASKNGATNADDGSARTRPRWLAISLIGIMAVAGMGVAAKQFSERSEGNDTPSYDAAARESTHARAGADLTSDLRKQPLEKQYALAVKAVFGGGATQIRTDEGVMYRYGKGQLIWSSHAPILIMPGSHDEGSPVTTGTLGIFYLREKSGTFEVASRFPTAVDGSIMGNPPEWQVSEQFGDFPVIVSKSGGVWQGYSCGGTLVTELATSGPRDLVAFDSHYSNGGARADGEKDETVDGEITDIVRNKSFEVSFSGTSSFTHRYQRRGDNYVRLPGDDSSQIPTC